MVARSNPPLHDVTANRTPENLDLDPDSADKPYEPVQPAEAPRQQALSLVPPPDRLVMIGGAFVAAFAGGAVGYWLGRRRAQRPARRMQELATTMESAAALAPVAMQLLANPVVRALALRILLRQINRQIDH